MPPPTQQRASPHSTKMLLERILNLPPLQYTPPKKNPFSPGRVGRPRVFYPPSQPQKQKRERSRSPAPTDTRAQVFTKDGVLRPLKVGNPIPSNKRRLVEARKAEAENQDPGLPSPKPDEDSNGTQLSPETEQDSSPSSPAAPIAEKSRPRPIVPTIVGRKILLKFAPLPKPAAFTTSAVSQPTRTLVDSLLADTPSIAAKFPSYKIVWLRNGASGGQCSAFVAQLRSRKGDKYGPLAYAKCVPKIVDSVYDCSEIRAYERLANHRVAPGKDERNSIFVISLNAFLDNPRMKQWIFLFDMCHCDLLSVIRRPDQFPISENLQGWMAQTAAGLNHLHSIGVMHRDVKSENVLVDWQMNLRITDLGLAWTSERQEPLKSNVNYAHRYVGTKGLMAPEVVAVKERDWNVAYYEDRPEMNRDIALYGLKADYWGLGLLYFEMANYNNDGILSTEVIEEFIEIRSSCEEEGDLSPLRSFFTKRNIPLDVGDLLYRLIDSNPESRADFDVVYAHDFFYHYESDGPIFDVLFELSAARTEAIIPKHYYVRKLDASLTVSHMLSGNRISWINPQTDAFQFINEPL